MTTPSVAETPAFDLWTIYERPSDHPFLFVARRWRVYPARLAATGDVVTAATLEEVRELLPPGLFRLARAPGDEPQIVETWI